MESIVNDIDEKVNDESLTSKNKTIFEKSNSMKDYLTPQNRGNLKNKKNTPAPKLKSHPSLAQRMSNRLFKYKKSVNLLNTEEYQTKSSARSGNNPLYNYPKYPPALYFDPKYSRNNKNNLTKFVTTATVNGETINLMDTIGKFNNLIIIDRLYNLRKEYDEKVEAQRFLKYQEELRGNKSNHRSPIHIKKSKSVCILPLYKRSYELSVQRDHNIKKKQRDRVSQLEEDFKGEIEIHSKLSVHNKLERRKFTQEGNFDL